MRIIRKRANVLIITIFILFIVSLVGILVSKYVKNILNYSSEFNKYYKAYYLAYGGLEIELTKIYNHGFGFEDQILSGGYTNKNNISYCPGEQCFFDTKINNLSYVLADDYEYYNLSGCNSDNVYVLNKGEGFIVPLFRDQNYGEAPLSIQNYRILSWANFRNIQLYGYDAMYERFSVGIAIIDNITKNVVQMQGPSDIFIKGFNDTEFNGLEYDENAQSFLVIGNNEGSLSTQKFCLSSNVKLPGPYIVIKSLGKYFDRYVSLQAIKQSKLPDYLIYSIIR